ncbi:hypothetical protein WN51_10468 [Melipona quadrifasciata]|uniref:Uncharacterized protein n=1 Tax=Melipona quadrifasciata TaxID=166423 RepID=A0A0N0U6J6_9HYME|nr:hypothetical protein WN51_10468 [Melipona quadrifasciata]
MNIFLISPFFNSNSLYESVWRLLRKTSHEYIKCTKSHGFHNSLKTSGSTRDSSIVTWHHPCFMELSSVAQHAPLSVRSFVPKLTKLGEFEGQTSLSKIFENNFSQKITDEFVPFVPFIKCVTARCYFNDTLETARHCFNEFNLTRDASEMSNGYAATGRDTTRSYLIYLKSFVTNKCPHIEEQRERK